MKANLLIRNKEQFERLITLREGTYTLGNASELEIPLLFPTVSRLHGQLEARHGELLYSDLSSRNGTFFLRGLERRILRGSASLKLEIGDRLQIGPYELVVTEFLGARATTSQELLKKLWHHASQGALSSIEFNREQMLMAWAAEQRAGVSAEDLNLCIKRVLSELTNHGPFSEYFLHEDCSEILANDYGDLYVDSGTGLKRLAYGFSCIEAYRAWVNRLVELCGRRLDLQNPLCEGTLPGGARLQAVLSPLCSGSVTVAVRKFREKPISEEEALASGWVNERTLSLLKNAVQQKANIVIAGGTSSGKTTLLGFLATYFAHHERIITVEDTFELKLALQNVTSLQARRANSDGIGEIALRQLVQTALRLRPDRLIIGEVRGPEVLDMLQALNTGHPGSLTTIHANSARDALSRLELLGLLSDGKLTSSALKRWIGGCIDYVVFVERTERGRRMVREIHRVVFEKEELQTEPVYENT